MSEGCFVIEVDEFFSAKPARNPVKAVSRCYVSMCDGHAESLFPPDRTMHLRSLADRLNEKNTAVITLVKRKKNGDALFEAKIEDPSGWSGCTLTLTLHAATDVCTVIVHSAGRLKREAGTFKGRVYPCAELRSGRWAEPGRRSPGSGTVDGLLKKMPERVARTAKNRYLCTQL